MHPLNIDWKNYLLPAGMAMVSIWSLYLGAVAVFQPIDSGTVDTEVRLARHNETARSDRGGTPARSAGRVTDADDVRPASRNENKDRSSNRDVAAQKQTAKTGSASKSKKVVVASGNQAKASSAKPGRGLAKKHKGSADAKAKLILRESIINEAVDVALKSEKPWENLIVVAMEQYRRGDLDDARAILLMAEKMAADPDDELASSKAVRAVVKAMLQQRQSEDAMNALQNIQSSHERERAIADVAAWSARLGEIDMARNLIVQIVHGARRDVALVAIAESEAAHEGMATAMQTVSLIVNDKKKDDAYRRIALKRGYLKDFAAAEQVIQQIRNEKLKDSTLTVIARLRARTGDVSGGLQSLQNVNDQSMEDTTLRQLATELAKSGKFSTSAYVTTRIRSDRERSYAIASLSVEQAKSGDLSGSLVRTDSIPIDSVRERTLRSVSSVTAGKGSPAQARNVAIRINRGKERDRAYRAIAQAAAADGDHVTAYNTVQDMHYPDEKALALVSMARARQRQGDARQALALLADADREALAVESKSTVDRIQADMAVVYAERRDASYSLLVAEKIRDQRRRDNTYRHLAHTLAGSDLHAAQQSVLSISSDKVRVTAEDAVARTLAKKVSPQDAVRSARSLHSGRQRIVFLLAVSRKT